jgi:uncharacterized membrane protein YcaP (DUF421 family)
MTEAFQHMANLDLPVLEKILRPILVYFFLLFALRVAGKRELSDITPFDLVVILMLSNTVQNAIIGDDTSLIGGLLGAVALLTINFVTVRVLFRLPSLAKKVEGEATVLICNGVLDLEKLKDEVITCNDLEARARQHGYRRLEEIDEAILESDGEISFFPKRDPAEQNAQILRELAELKAELKRLRS